MDAVVRAHFTAVPVRRQVLRRSRRRRPRKSSRCREGDAARPLRGLRLDDRVDRVEAARLRLVARDREADPDEERAARVIVSISPPTRRRYSRPRGVSKAPIVTPREGRSCSRGRRCRRRSRTTAWLERAASRRARCVNQLKTSGRSRPVEMRPSTPPTGLIAGLPPAARRSASPGTMTSESPAIQMRSLCCGVNSCAARAGGRGSATAAPRRRRAATGTLDRGVDLVVRGAAERRLERAARPVEEGALD